MVAYHKTLTFYSNMTTKFFSLYLSSENEGEQLQSKLVNTYTNRFCIDEEDQSEIAGFHFLSELSQTSFASSLLKYTNIFLFHDYVGLRKIKSLFEAAQLSFVRRGKRSMDESNSISFTSIFVRQNTHENSPRNTTVLI